MLLSLLQVSVCRVVSDVGLRENGLGTRAERPRFVATNPERAGREQHRERSPKEAEEGEPVEGRNDNDSVE